MDSCKTFFVLFGIVAGDDLILFSGEADVSPVFSLFFSALANV